MLVGCEGQGLRFKSLRESFTHIYTYTVFGWGENREDEKQRGENRVENSVFHCLEKEGIC